jgi:hypothetical protein
MSIRELIKASASKHENGHITSGAKMKVYSLRGEAN